MNEILVKHTGQTLDKIEKETDRDKFMSAQEAVEYGLVDHVLERLPADAVRPRNEG
jgi:ATP-dependent Clp protease protease subunit